MVRILERPKSTGDRFLEAFANVGQQLPEELGAIQKQRSERQSAISKNLGSLSGYLSKELKNRGRKSLAEDPRYLSELHEKIRPLVEAGYDPYEAFESVYSEMESQRPQKSQQPSSLLERLLGESNAKAKSPFDVAPGTSGKFSERRERSAHPFGLAGEFIEPAAKAIKSKPSLLATELPTAALRSAEDLGALHDPLTAAIQRLIGKREQPSASGILSNKLRQGLSAEEREGAEKIAQGEQLLLELLGPSIAGKVKGLLGRGRALIPSQILPAEKQATQKLLGYAKKTAEESVPTAERSLAGRISKAPETATEMRVSRTKPSQRIYPRSSNIAIREAQIKAYPKYEAEIAQDAAERAERAAKRVPKTVKGMDSKKLRMHEAEKNWPKAQESYNKSSGRVRALEDEVASLKGEAKDSAKGILEAAKKDLEDATFQLKQSFENLKGVNVRAGKEAMRDAARKKIGQIQEAVSSGEEYKIAKMDYNPEHISRANYLTKRKPLPKTRTSDFYTDVHGEYVNEYNNRIGKIDAEIKGLPKNMQGLSRGRELQQEKDILKKMVASADAEKAIQNNRFALRETAERKKAQERFAALKKTEGQPKVKEVSQKMWKERIKEIKTTEGREKVAEEITEQVAAKNPKLADRIHAEKRNLNEALGKIEQETEKLKEGLKSASNPKQAKEKATSLAKSWNLAFENLLKKIPVIGKTQIGRDILTGSLTGIIDEVRKEYELPFSSGAIVAATLGRSRGAPVRILANQFTKHLLKQYHISQAEKAYRNHDDERLKEFSPAIKKKAKERAFG